MSAYGPPQAVSMQLRNRNTTLSRETQEDQGIQRRTVLEILQSEGLPNLVERCRSGTDAEKERAAATLAFCASNDLQAKMRIVSAGGLPPLIAMLSAEDGAGDGIDDDGDESTENYDMKEQAVKTMFALCNNCPSNQRPVAERGAIPPLVKILTEKIQEKGSQVGVPWSIKEAAVDTLGLLSLELAGGLSQEILHAEGGVPKLLAVSNDPDCSGSCRAAVHTALRNLATYAPAAAEMKALGHVVAPVGC